MDPEAAKSRDEREIMLLGPRQAESCRSHVQDYLQGSRLVHGEAFTAAIFDACVNFVRTRIHPSSLAAQSPPCTRPPNALPDTQQRRQPQASSVEGYHNASAASTASINCRSHVQDYLHGSRSVHEAAFTAATLGACVHFVCCINTSVACIHFSWQQAARNSQEQ